MKTSTISLPASLARSCECAGNIGDMRLSNELQHCCNCLQAGVQTHMPALWHAERVFDSGGNELKAERSVFSSWILVRKLRQQSSKAGNKLRAASDFFFKRRAASIRLRTPTGAHCSTVNPRSRDNRNSSARNFAAEGAIDKVSLQRVRPIDLWNSRITLASA